MENLQKYFVGQGYATDIRIFAEVLSKFKIITDTSNFNKPEIYQDSSVMIYRYSNLSLSNPNFISHVNKIKHKKPNSAEISKIIIDRFELIYEFDSSNNIIHCNSAYSIHGVHETKSGDVEDNMLAFHWDSDKSCFTSPSPPESYCHPLYHVQWGGKSMWDNEDQDFSYGNILMLESPRISHPPMDLILLIDFIVTYYINETDSKSIKSAQVYISTIKKMQEFLWKSYYDHIANHFAKVQGNTFAKCCNPQLILPISIE